MFLSWSGPALNPAIVAQTELSLEQTIQKARKLIDLEKYKDAKKELSKALKQDKNSYDANVLMALVQKNSEKRRDAIKYAYEAVRLQPENPEGHYLLALLFYETNETGQAANELNMVFQKGGQFANAYALKGYIGIAEQDYKAALEDFSKALQLTPKASASVAKWQEMVEFLKSYVDFRSLKEKSAITPPVALNAPRPNYSDEARSKRVQGGVLLVLRVTEQGLVKGWILRKGLGYGLDEQAILAAQQIRFKPAMKDGNPITYWQTVAIEFNLR